MRHKYTTTAFVLSRTPIGEASAFITLLTPDLGIIRTRVQGIRKPGAKLASALQTLSETDVTLVRGKEGWRLSGAVLVHSWFSTLERDPRERTGRTAGLLLRLVHGESIDPSLFSIFSSFIVSLGTIRAEEWDAAECLAVIRFLQLLGLDAGTIPEGVLGGFSTQTLHEVSANRQEYILRINRGIAASGL
jgi:recombinational DNA repair protein (RecF pathway)